MLLQILKHTPLPVFAVFIGLVVLGLLQTQPRQVSRRRLAVLPAIMLALSFAGVLSFFGHGLVVLAAWAGAVCAVAAIGLAGAPPRGVSWCAASQRFTRPGSWLPLALMMCIFFTKYAVAVARAVHPGFPGTTAGVAALCALYGAFSGVFLARALRTARVARQSHVDPAQVATRALDRAEAA